MRSIIILILALAPFFAGCSSTKEYPVSYDPREVKPVVRPKKPKTITVVNAMTWYDDAPATRDIRFPAGVYQLEAEDDEYWYLRSPKDLEFHILDSGESNDVKEMSGGIMFAKSSFSEIPAAGYVDGEYSTKVMVWKLNDAFIDCEGQQWKKSF